MKKRTIFNLLMFLLIVFLGYVLYTQIEEPINFQRTKNVREEAVIQQLIQIRKAQEAYRSITGRFAGSFQQLTDTLTYGNFKIVKEYGDKDDPNFKPEDARKEIILRPAKDSIDKIGIILTDIGKVPFGDGIDFDIKADTANYQSTTVDVVEVGIAFERFMGQFGDKKFKKYDERYDPKKKIKFGDLSKPILTGSWE